MDHATNTTIQTIYKALSKDASIPDWITAIGTLLLAFTAVFNDWLKALIFKPRAEIREENLQGELTYFSNSDHSQRGPDVYFYHLKVVNIKRLLLPRSATTLKDCRVLLTGISFLDRSIGVRRIPLSVPQQFRWAPAETTSALINISIDHVFDFGMLIKGGKAEPTRFMPALFGFPNNFQGILLSRGTIRYELKIEAENFRSKSPVVVEVIWNGEWNQNPQANAKNIQIKLLDTKNE